MADQDITTKPCTKCGITKPTTEFGKRHKSGNELCSWCRACKKIANAEWKSSNRLKIKAYSSEYYAAHKVRIRAADAARYIANSEKQRAYSAEYRANNPEEVKAYAAEWRANNPEAAIINNHNRRARKLAAGGKLSKGLTKKLFNLQRGKCACGCKQPLGGDFHRDHIMPVALGGTNTDDNMQLLRKTCNLQKHAKHPIDFMQSRGLLL